MFYLIVSVSKYVFSKRVKLGSLLKDFCQDFHERGACLEVFVIAEADRVHQAGVDVGAQQVGHGLDCCVS